MKSPASCLTHRNPAPRRTGFTLLELIAVMGIIVALSLVIVGSYVGIMRTLAEMAGVNAVRRAMTLTRQHATIDGRDTYFFITGFDTYVICRRGGVISDRHTRSLTGDEKPAYLPPGQYSDAIWIYDRYSDLGAASESFAGVATDDLSDLLEDYAGTKLFDLRTGEAAEVRYPPWFSPARDSWVMGIDRGASGFAIGSVYGWTVYPEQRLPKGYAFVRTKDNFIEEGSLFFKADGTMESRDNLSSITIQELGTGKLSTVKIHANGKIEAAY